MEIERGIFNRKKYMLIVEVTVRKIRDFPTILATHKEMCKNKPVVLEKLVMDIRNLSD